MTSLTLEPTFDAMLIMASDLELIGDVAGIDFSAFTYLDPTFALSAEMIEWCRDSLSAMPTSDGFSITFATPEDATMFKLFWADYC